MGVALLAGVELPMVALGTGSGQKGDVASATTLALSNVAIPRLSRRSCVDASSAGGYSVHTLHISVAGFCAKVRDMCGAGTLFCATEK